MLSKSRVGLQLAGRAARSGLVTISTSPACSASGATAREKTLDTACLADRCSIAYIRQMQGPACSIPSRQPASDSPNDATVGTGLNRGIGGSFLDLRAMPVVEMVSEPVLESLLEYSALSPTPISIEQFIERGSEENWSEEQSYNHLKREVTIRLAHIIMELQHLPKDLHAEERCRHTIRLYAESFTKILEFQERPADSLALDEFMETLTTFKSRHQHTVPDMAGACKAMKVRLGIPEESSNSPEFAGVKVFLDRLYTNRISIHMITNQHLGVYGHERVPPAMIGVIHPDTSVISILADAIDEATFHTENCYMVAPKVNIRQSTKKSLLKSQTEEDAGFAHLVPSHLFLIMLEVLKNAMRATVETHWDSKDRLPAITAMVCTAEDDITVKISDQGGGMTRAQQEKIFDYEYSTEPKNTLCEKSCGYGLPLARLYARYFHGDLRVSSYDGFGTDVYIYTSALASLAVERLPIYSPDTVEAWCEEEEREDDWSSSVGTRMAVGVDHVSISVPDTIIESSGQ